MQKIFLIEYNEQTNNINDFLGTSGKVISVTPQKVGGEGNKGKFLVVVDDGNGGNTKL